MDDKYKAKLIAWADARATHGPKSPEANKAYKEANEAWLEAQPKTPTQNIKP